MYKDLYRTCTAIVLLMKPFVWRRSRCHRRRGLLKFPKSDRRRCLSRLGPRKTKRTQLRKAVPEFSLSNIVGRVETESL